MLPEILAIALALIAGFVFLLLKKRYRGLGLGFAMCCVAVLVGLWAIVQSRSSTAAAIGILFLPFYGLLSGLMAWGFANLRAQANRALRVLGWLCLCISLGAPIFLAYGGFHSIALNQARDAKHAADTAEIERHRRHINEALAHTPGYEAETIATLINEHASDRNFLLPALDNRFVTPETLDRFARSDDFGIALTAVRNRNCPPQTLVRIYRTHAYPDYFFQTLAAHENTPPETLTDLYRRPATIQGLDRSFARNPATPKAILADIAGKTHETFVVQQLLQNPKLDCTLIGAAEAALKRSERPDDRFSIGRLQEIKAGICASATDRQ